MVDKSFFSSDQLEYNHTQLNSSAALHISRKEAFFKKSQQRINFI